MAKQVNPNGKKSRCNRNKRLGLFAGKPIDLNDKSRDQFKKKRREVNTITMKKSASKPKPAAPKKK